MSGFELRTSIRTTWASEESRKDFPISIIFILGTNPKNPTLQQDLEKESETYGDILQVEQQFNKKHRNCKVDNEG